MTDVYASPLFPQYYDEAYPTVKEQRTFEKSLFEKTSRTNGTLFAARPKSERASEWLLTAVCLPHYAGADIVMFEGITCVFKSNVDLLFYVFGSATENELMLASVLNGFYDAVRMVVRENVEKVTLFQCLSTVLMILDEIVDGGYVTLHARKVVVAY